MRALVGIEGENKLPEGVEETERDNLRKWCGKEEERWIDK